MASGQWPDGGEVADEVTRRDLLEFPVASFQVSENQT